MNYRSGWSCLDLVSHAQNNPKKIIWRKDLLEVRFCFAAQFIFDLYLQIPYVMKTKPPARWRGSENFYLPFSFWLIFVCSAETLCSCTPWPCLGLTGCSTSYSAESYCTVLKITPPSRPVRRHSAPSVQMPGVYSSACCFSGGDDDKRAYDQKVNSGATFQ